MCKDTSKSLPDPVKRDCTAHTFKPRTHVSGDIGRFNKKRPTFGPCVCQLVPQKPASIGRACWKTSSQPAPDQHSQPMAGGRPPVRPQQLSRGDRCTNISSLVQRLQLELTTPYVVYQALPILLCHGINMYLSLFCLH